jgi:hypothetical protein
MPYIGTSPSQGVRRVHTYTATASQTTFTGAGAEGATLSYKDSNFVDVYQNGVKLGDADYTATSGTSIVLGTAATVSDLIVIVAYDVFSVADTVSKSDGGTFDGTVTFAGGITGPLAINDGDAGSVTANTVGDELVIESSGAGGLSILTPNASDAQVLLGGPDTNAGAILRWNDDANLISLGTNNTGGTLALKVGGFSDALTIDASANVTITGDIRKSTAGTSNFAAGVNAGNSITSGGNYNTVVGDEAGTALASGDENVAVGYQSLESEIGGQASTAIGYRALYAQNTSNLNKNTAVGHGAGESVTSGLYNTLIGADAGDELTDADRNTVVGVGSLQSDTLGSRSTAMGYGSLGLQNFTSATDSNNTAIGYASGANVTTGIQNTIIGANASDALTDADYNVAVGNYALTSDTRGSRSTAIGWGALSIQNLTSAADSHNTAVGYGAGENITTGVQNTIIGGLAGDALTDADDNIAIGLLTLTSDTKGSKTVAIGVGALQTQNFTSSTDTYNTAVGFNAGNAVTTAVQSVYIGGLAGDADQTGGKNVYVGYSAGTANVGDQNVCIGRNSGGALTNADKNLILGNYDGNEDNLDLRTADDRIVLANGDGKARLHINHSGLFTFSNDRSEGVRKDSTDFNTIHSSLSQITLMLENTGSSPYGQMIDFSSASPDNNTNYFLKCEDGTAERLYIFSDGDIYNHDGTFAQISDRRIKDNITNANSQWDDIKAMRFVNYQRKDDIRQYGESEAKVQLGLIGQELEAISPNLVRSVDPSAGDIISSSEFGSLYVEGDDIPEGKQVGDVKEVTEQVKGVAYSILYLKAVKALQEAMTRIETLEAKVATLEGE